MEFLKKRDEDISGEKIGAIESEQTEQIWIYKEMKDNIYQLALRCKSISDGKMGTAICNC